MDVGKKKGPPTEECLQEEYHRSYQGSSKEEACIRGECGCFVKSVTSSIMTLTNA
jgi:hypothetical protein